MPSFPLFECFKKCFKSKVAQEPEQQQAAPHHRTGPTVVSYDLQGEPETVIDYDPEGNQEMERCFNGGAAPVRNKG